VKGKGRERGNIGSTEGRNEMEDVRVYRRDMWKKLREGDGQKTGKMYRRKDKYDKKINYIMPIN
jgi:hypothetical protein